MNIVKRFVKGCMIVLGLALCAGCGLSVIKKNNLAQGLDQAKAAVDGIQGAICSDQAKAQVNDLYATLDALIEKYGK